MRLTEFMKSVYAGADLNGGVFPNEWKLTKPDAQELSEDLSHLDMFLIRDNVTAWGKHHPLEILDSMTRGDARLMDIKLTVEP